LNVFPIILPPLRERPEDVLLLANHFIGIYAQKEGKKIDGIADQVAKEMVQYAWPGNVRELENLIRRSVLLTAGNLIDTFYIQKTPANTNQPSASEPLKTMEENDRAHILTALKRCDWKIYGPGGAAELLNLNVNTLNSRIKKLGIEKNS
jgi:transcriptional regulator with GAF, ATPase, and Fis domain